jgi:hypothetical protein
LARRLSGRSAPRYTSGPATQAALAAAGAQGASTGDVVHLPVAPSASGTQADVLRHEQLHLRQPVSRPRFWLASPSGALDSEERSVRSATARHDTSAGIIAGLPVAGGTVEVVRAAAQQAVAMLMGSSAGGTATGLEVAAHGAGFATTPGASTSSAGDVPGWPAHGPAGQQTAGYGPAEPGDGRYAGWGAPTSGADRSTPAAPAGPDAPPVVPDHVVDSLVDALEQRLLAELERRGGRYAGVF